MSIPTKSPRARYDWFSRGDINAFFGLMLDNVGDMILMATLLVGVFQMPREFVLTKMIPGTAICVFVGDAIYTFMAFRLAAKTGRSVTAMPLGLDTPSTFGSVFLIIGPAFAAAQASGMDEMAAARHAWYTAIAMILASGIFKVASSTICGLIRRVVPRAGLLGSLTAIALVIISFLPLLEIAALPIAGFSALAIILMTLTARWDLPKRIPGALAGVIVGCVIYYAMAALGLGPGFGGEAGRPVGGLQATIPLPILDWLEWIGGNWEAASRFLPVALPLALATIVGGIDCTESAAHAGDEYPTGPIVFADGLATIAGGIFGGVIQSTAYIGHPAYKAMDARAGYTLLTALFVGSAGVFGFFAWIFYLVPKAAVFPILIFVGLEITAQSFAATPKRHYPAVALACVPALAYLALIALKQVLPTLELATLAPESKHWVQTVLMLANGFIVTSLIWSTVLAKLIDGEAGKAAVGLGIAAIFACFGVIHSPLPDAPLSTPWAAIEAMKATGRFEAAAGQTPYHWAAAYALLAVLVWAVSRFSTPPPADPDEHPIAI
ncbi:MAG: permease [Isosphaeraceae bacterium]|nr:permease [Isosphaeraceae bacterium]